MDSGGWELFNEELIMPWKGRMGYMNSGALLPAIFSISLAFYWLFCCWCTDLEVQLLSLILLGIWDRNKSWSFQECVIFPLYCLDLLFLCSLMSGKWSNSDCLESLVLELGTVLIQKHEWNNKYSWKIIQTVIDSEYLCALT